jgi:hypothetical protein
VRTTLVASMFSLAFACSATAAPPTSKQIEVEWAKIRAKHPSFRLELTEVVMQKAKTLPEDFPPEDLTRKHALTVWLSKDRYRLDDALDSKEKYDGRDVLIQTPKETIMFTGDGHVINSVKEGSHRGWLTGKKDEPRANHVLFTPIAWLFREGTLKEMSEPTLKDGKLILTSKRQQYVEEVALESTPPFAMVSSRLNAWGFLVATCEVKSHEIRGGIRLPNKWMHVSYQEGYRKQGKLYCTTDIEMKAFDPSTPIDDSVFKFEMPPRTRVVDDRTGKVEEYLIRSNGLRRYIRKDD